jgi:2-C-methyl-D-erythritol 2,4-cyclodiphosphate synthase
MYRIGHGFDQHPLEPGRPLWLGGVRIEFPKGLKGHSDGDVLVHALCNALLGALGKGDLGQHFPSDDPQWRGVQSLKLLEAVMGWVSEGFEVVNADLTLIVSEPRMAPFLPEMKGRLAPSLKVAEGRMNIKASHPEGIGSLGRGAGIAAHCVVLLKEKGSVQGIV